METQQLARHLQFVMWVDWRVVLHGRRGYRTLRRIMKQCNNTAVSQCVTRRELPDRTVVFRKFLGGVPYCHIFLGWHECTNTLHVPVHFAYIHRLFTVVNNGCLASEKPFQIYRFALLLHVRQVFCSKLRVVLNFWFASKCIRMGHSNTGVRHYPYAV